jgi:dTDP-4-amino-4,6-dideoxygalactose transaminase
MAFASGTEALAAVLAFAAIQRSVPKKLILPAYSCPDIVSAAQYAELSPEFIDLAPGQTSPAAGSFERALLDGARVVLLVDLFGVMSDDRSLRDIAKRFDAFTVHDLAQTFAGPGYEQHSAGDAVVVSYGRGKPVSLLSGGAVSTRPDIGFDSFARARYAEKPWQQYSSLMKAVAYNVAISPMLYGLISRLPSLHVGQAALRPVRTVNRLPAAILRQAHLQLSDGERWMRERRERSVEFCNALSRLGYVVPEDAKRTAAARGLNRVPVLCGSEERAERVFSRARKFGVTRMYGRTLPEFVGMQPGAAKVRYPVAFEFSRTVLTVPTHSRLNRRERAAIVDAFRHES